MASVSDRDERGASATRLLAVSVAAIVVSLLIMVVACINGPSVSVPGLTHPAGFGSGPPWWHPLHLHPAVVLLSLWAAAVFAVAGVAAGLVAVSRGARLPVRPLLVGVFVVIAIFTVLPPGGSTDAVSYGIDGAMVAAGHNPYVMTPNEFLATGAQIARNSPKTWQNSLSDYGPLATASEWAAAELGGNSMARITFWLKLWTSLAFGAVVLLLDWLLKPDPAMRLRAHLLWSANPLLLWVLVAAGHLDVMGAAAGFLGMVVLYQRGPGDEPGALRGLVAGLLVGAAVDIKASYVAFGIGIAWAARKSPAAWLSAAAGAALVLLPTYAWFGAPAVRALRSRDADASVDNYYQMFVGSHGNVFPHQLLLAGLLFGAVALLLLWRLPDGVPALPAIRPALAISLAWLFIWPYELPWYDSMALCLLALYPASRLDWLVLLRLTAATFALMPGNTGLPPQHLLAAVTSASLYWVAPALLLFAAVALVWLGLSQRWKMNAPTVIPAEALPWPA